MPEGPSLVILRQETAGFTGQTIARVGGNTAIEKQRLVGQRLVALRTWGKHFLIQLPRFSVRIHLLMFGSWRINEAKTADRPARLSLFFDDGQEIHFYTCSVRFIEEDLDQVYDWSADVLSDAWDPRSALRKLRQRPELLACDALLDQNVFAGVGNIIKNEVLFRIRVHPLSAVGALPPAKLRALVDQARAYSFEFLFWKLAYMLRAHLLAHTRKTCPRCERPFVKAHLGTTHRRSFYCENCQKRYV
jgi:endonuclease-8